MFIVRFDTDNDAFTEPDGFTEVTRILHNVAAQVRDGATGGRVHDLNGNTVGSWEWSDQS